MPTGSSCSRTFAECFHCPTVHPELCTIVEAFWEGGAFQWRMDDNGIPIREIKSRYKDGAVSLTMDGSSMVPAFKHLEEEGEGATVYHRSGEAQLLYERASRLHKHPPNAADGPGKACG